MTSKAAELAREEAERVESEDAEDQADASDDQGEPVTSDGEGDTTHGVEPPAAVSPEPLNEAQIDAIWKALGREAERHRKETAKRAGPMLADLAPCPCCEPDIPGFMFPQLPPEAADARLSRIFAAFGLDGGDQLREARDKEACSECGGWAKVKSGSKDPTYAAMPCASCGGKGFVTKMPTMANLVAPPNGSATAYNIVEPQPPAPVTDAWGRQLGHPHFNIPPNEVGS